jgi:predicted RNase H-like HicB family nuclease
MRITLTVHREPTDDGICWWAETNDIPGFTAVANTMDELTTVCREAIKEISDLDGLKVTQTVYEMPAETHENLRPGQLLPSRCTLAAGRDGNETCTCGHLFMAHRFRNRSTIVCCELCDLVEANKIRAQFRTRPDIAERLIASRIR